MKEKLLSNTQTSFDDIKESYARICENIEKAKTAAGRKDDVRLMAVTKTVDPERINYAVGLGIDLLARTAYRSFLKSGRAIRRLRFISSAVCRPTR